MCPPQPPEREMPEEIGECGSLAMTVTALTESFGRGDRAAAKRFIDDFETRPRHFRDRMDAAGALGPGN
jgi:hypothetical protein